jgi:hypothetical protein
MQRLTVITGWAAGGRYAEGEEVHTLHAQGRQAEGLASE